MEAPQPIGFRVREALVGEGHFCKRLTPLCVAPCTDLLVASQRSLVVPRCDCQALQRELWRCDAAIELDKNVAAYLKTTLTTTKIAGLLSAFIFETIAARANHDCPSSRSGVWKFDEGCHVVLHSKNVCEIEKGILKSIVVDNCDSSSNVEVVLQCEKGLKSCCVGWKNIQLEVPAPIFADPLLPCGEALSNSFMASKSIFKRVCVLLHDSDKLYRVDAQKRERRAWEIAQQISFLAFESRRQLHSRISSSAVSNLECSFTDTGQCVSLRVGIVAHEITAESFAKLRTMFCGDSADFPRSVFVMLHRYYGATGKGDTAEAGWHGAIPPTCIKLLHEKLGVGCEAFASPLNTSTKVFCSAFFDTDGCFGSVGSFLSTKWTSGSFEVNPPFDHSVVEATVVHMDKLLCGSSCPLSFIVFLPVSDKGRTLSSMASVVEALEHSKYTAASAIFHPNECPYVDGNQHCVANSFFFMRHSTGVFVLQNEQGALKWPAKPALQLLAALWAGESEPSSSTSKRKRCEVEQ